MRVLEAWTVEGWLSGRLAMPRAICVYAHPDDEAVAVGARLPLFADSLFVQVTDGAPEDNADAARLGLEREEYRAAREQELMAAFRAGGLPVPQVVCLRYPDKGAALHLPELMDRMAGLLGTERPDVVFTHPYEGGHADHDACAFAVHTAVRMLAKHGQTIPVIIESPFYHAEHGEYVVGRFLQRSASAEEIVLPLSADEQQTKRAALDAFATQRDVLRQFGVGEERFRPAPPYDFTRPPHNGPAYYERFIAGMTASRFCALTTEAFDVRCELTACR